MVQTHTVEVPEERAEGKVKTIYEEIKQTLRAPLVNLVFRVLATHPDFLQIAWIALKPNAQTVYFEQRADLLRRHAAQAMARLGTGPRPAATEDDIRRTLDVFHYLNPKLLFAVAALRAAAHGQVPALMELSPDQKRQIAPGVPSEAGAVTMVDPEAADERVRQVFEDIQSTLSLPTVNSDYRALAQWPEYLEQAWQSTKGILDAPEYWQTQRELRRLADEGVLALPFRMDISPHVMRQAGLSEQEIDDVRDTLDRFYPLLAGLTANISYLTTGIKGPEAALASPFPAALL